MAYIDSSFNYIGYLDTDNNKQEQAILDLIDEQSKSSWSGTRFNYFTADTDGKLITGIQLFLYEDSLKLLKKNLEDIGIQFDNVFKRDWGHIHPYYYIKDEYFECIAEGTEDGWQLYYEDDEKGFVSEDRLYIGFVSNSDIDKRRDLNKVFEKWLKGYLRID